MSLKQIKKLFLKGDSPTLTTIQYLQIDPSRKGTHTKEIMMLRMFFFLYRFVRWTKCIWWAIESFLSLQMNEFLQSEIKQKLFPVLKFSWIPAVADKKILVVFCVSAVLCSPCISLLFKLKSSSAWFYFLLGSTVEEKKRLTNSFVN